MALAGSRERDWFQTMKTFENRKSWKPWATTLLIVAGAALVWLAPSRARPAVDLPNQEPVAPPARSLDPEPRTPGGGPFISSVEAADVASNLARRRGVVDPQDGKVRLMTYGEAVAANRTGWNRQIHADREVYLVSIEGSLKFERRGGSRSFTRTFYVIDATTGDMIDWGATNLPDPFDPVPARPPVRPVPAQ